MALIKWPALVGAVTTAVWAAFTLYFIFETYHQHRVTDFTSASKGPIIGTCLETVTDKQLKSAKYDESGWNCKTSSKESLANLLTASVHSIYQKSSQFSSADDLRVVHSALSSALGTAGDELTREQVYSVLSNLGTPASVDCDVIYSGASRGEVLSIAPVSPTIACDADYTAATAAADYTAITNAVNELYTHCWLQHSYAYSWPATGTFGIPKYGTDAKPIILPVLVVNSTTTPGQRAQILVGTRFGFSSIAYIFFVITASFYCMDGIILSLAELTRADSYKGQNALVEGGSDEMRIGMLTMLATFKSKRNLRWAVASLLVIVEVVLYVLLIGVPWMFGMNFPRPICETGGAEHWIGPFTEETNGGWKKDYDAFYLEIMTLGSHILILIIPPILSRISMIRGNGGGATGRSRTTGEGGDVGFTGVATESLRTGWWLSALVLGGIVLYLGTAVAEFRYGFAWAEGVIHNRFDEVALGSMIIDSIDALLYLSITIGLTLGSIVTRWLLSGLSCTSFTIFIFWVIFAVSAFIPPFFVSTYYVFFAFEESKGQENCQSIFGDSSDYLFARTACDVQGATYIAGIILLIVAVGGPIVLGLYSYVTVLRKSRRRAWVALPEATSEFTFERQLETTARTNANNPSKFNGTSNNEVTHGYRSKHTEFFNFPSQLEPEKKPLL